MMNSTPRLRFTEFSKVPQYTQYKFDDIFVFSSGKNIKKKEASPEFNTPCVRYGELYHMYGEVITKTINCTNLDRSELTFSYGNEILLPSAGEDPLDIGSASALTLKGVAIGRTINVLRPKGNIDYSHTYVSYYINEKLRKKISKLARGASISNVYNSDLKTLKANLPEIFEQQKIASFLSKVDEKIGLLSEKKDKLTEYKKGVMQQLFSGEWRIEDGEHIFIPPILRFKADDGSKFPDWDSARLCEYAVFKGGNGFKESYQGRTFGDLPFIKVSDMNNLGNEKLIINSNNYISTQDAQALKVNVFSAGTIVFAKVGAALLLNRRRVLSRNTIIDNNMMAAIVKPKMNNLFLYQYLLTVDFGRFVQEGAVPSINQGDMNAIKVTFPSPEEQSKIADFLSAIDQKIELANSALNKTKEWKKGLLQQMFV